MKKLTLYLILDIVFSILTFCGAGYVLYNRGQVSAGYAVVPLAIALISSALYRKEKNKNH